MSGDLANKKIMLLVKGPQAILGLMDKGVEIKNVNVGNVRPKDYTKEIVSHIYARESDIEAWKENPVLNEEAFDKLQLIMTEAGELEKKAPYDKIVNNYFAEKVSN